MAEMYSIEQAFKVALEHFHAARYTEAEHIFRQLVAVINRHESLSYFFGMTCCQLGKIDEGVIWLRKTIDINPAHAQAYTNLGVALFKLGRLVEAEDALRRALSAAPDFLEGWIALRHIAGQRADWREVMRILERIAALSGQGNKEAVQYIDCLLESELASPANILEIMGEGIWKRPELSALYAPLLNHDIPERERREHILMFRRGLDNLDLDGWGCLHLVLVWRHLFDLGWYSSHIQPDPACTPRHVENAILFNRSTEIVNILRYKLDSPREWNERLFREYIVPLVKRCQESGNYWVLFKIGIYNDMVFAQQPHTEQQSRYCYDALKPCYIAAGVELGKRWGSLEIPSSHAPVVVFHAEWYINNSSPDKVIMHILKGWYLSEHKAFTPVVISSMLITGEVRSFLDAIGIKYMDLSDLPGMDPSCGDGDSRLQILRKEIERHKMTALVSYVSSTGFSSLLAASRIAPVQVHYSMGYHYMDGPGWDAFFCVGSAGETSRTYDGRPWRAIPLSHQDPRASPNVKELTNAGRSIRAKRFSRETVVLGAIARPQKLDNEEFLGALATLLKKNRNVVFLWFESNELAAVRQKMIALGISDQCLFEGYQNTSTYAQVLDIHLDPFPFPSGLSILDTMCYGVPSVFMNTRSAFNTGVPGHIFPLLRRECGTREQQDAMNEIFYDRDTGESLALLANTVDEYVALVQRLIEDKAFRRKVGQAGQHFMETFMIDPKISYESFSRHILEVIEEKKAATQRKGLT